MEKINYLDQYGRNNLTEKPLEYYLEAFEKTDPYKISCRLGIHLLFFGSDIYRPLLRFPD